MTLEMAVIAAAIFTLAIVLSSIVFRGVGLDKVVLYQGEEILFEEKGLKVEHGGLIKGAIFMNCIVRVTGSRVLIAQKNLLSDNYTLKHMIVFGNEQEAAEQERKGFYMAKIDKSKIRFEPEPGKKKRTVVVIEIPYSSEGSGQYIRFITTNPEFYRNNF